MNILAAIADPKLFAPWFRDRSTWAAWLVFLAALFGLPLTPEQLAIYRKHTGLAEPPTEAATEAWLIIGRRGGKSFVMALVAVFLATFRDYRPFLQPGERATVMVIAADRRQARIILRYVSGLVSLVPALKRRVERETAEGYDLQGQVTIEIGTASHRTTRGYAFAAVLVDEIAFLMTGDDVAISDTEIINAIRPGMATIPGSVLLCASSPYARRGALWDVYSRHYGKPGGPLVWKAATRDMNPTVPQQVIDRALQADAASAGAEFMAEFRSDLEAYVSLDVVRACVSSAVTGRRYEPGLTYKAFVDPSGGSVDAMTLAIAHAEPSGQVVVDVALERRPPFSPDAVVTEFCAVLKAYGIATVVGDRYGGEFCREPFRKQGVPYKLAEKPRSDLYQGLLPLLYAGRIDLLDNPRLIQQIVGLERRVARGGRESIDHAPNQHDDLANSVAGAAALCVKPARRPFTYYVNGRVFRGGVEVTHKPVQAEPEAVHPVVDPGYFARMNGF